jgi:hypothetical protein
MTREKVTFSVTRAACATDQQEHRDARAEMFYLTHSPPKKADLIRMSKILVCIFARHG